MLSRASMLCAVWLCASCAATGGLRVDLRTDLAPGIEFASTLTTVLPTGRSQTTPAVVGDDAVTGVEVADFEGLPPGEYWLRISLLDARGALIVDRTVDVTIATGYVVTVVVTRDCRHVGCPAPGGDPTASACFGGRCVAPTCTDGTGPSCGTPECTSDVDCAPLVDCVDVRCVEGACFQAVADRCVSGEWCDPDSPFGCEPLPGPGGVAPGCECAPADTQMQVGGGCGNCGTWTETRMCDGCSWTPWVTTSCDGQGCEPGTRRTMNGGCGMPDCNGTKHWICSGSCGWVRVMNDDPCTEC